MEWKNEVTALLKIAYPVIQAPISAIPDKEYSYGRFKGQSTAGRPERVHYLMGWSGISGSGESFISRYFYPADNGNGGITHCINKYGNSFKIKRLIYFVLISTVCIFVL